MRQESKRAEVLRNLCLEKACNLLEKEVAPTAATIEAALGLARIAVELDMLSLRWAEQNRFGAAVFGGQSSLRQQEEN